MRLFHSTAFVLCFSIFSFNCELKSNEELRTWTAINGKEVDAEFVSLQGGIVKLKLASGRLFDVKLEKLSENDVEYIEILQFSDSHNDEDKEQPKGLKELSAKALKSVGTVLVKQNGKFVSNGSGFFISESGLFVTNWHVVKGYSEFQIEKTDGGTFQVSNLQYAHPDRDLAVLKIRGKEFTFLEISEEITTGDPIIVIGSPRGLGGTVTNGIVSAKRNFGDMGIDLDYKKDTKLIQITAAISPGSSGSAILSLESGKVIAVASFYEAEGQALNFGVSSQHIIKLLKEKTKPDFNQIENLIAKNKQEKIIYDFSKMSSDEWKSLEAKGDPEFLCQLGVYYLKRPWDEKADFGSGLTPTFTSPDSTAKLHFEKAANEGHIEAAYQLGMLYWKGLRVVSYLRERKNEPFYKKQYEIEAEIDITQAKIWLATAAGEGHPKAKAMLSVIE